MKSKILISMLFVLLFAGCEDDAPFEYEKNYLVDAILLVGDPIQNIKIMETQPLDESYSSDNSFVKNADVMIYTETDTFRLEYDYDNGPGYYFPDRNYKVQPETAYNLLVNMPDGTVITGETQTNPVFSWKDKPKQSFYYPKDTTKLPQNDSLDISWEQSGDNSFYLLTVKCLDTLNYGQYLTPATDEPNRRTPNPLMKNNNSQYRELSSYAFIMNTKTPTVWMVFKWFGPYEIKVFAPDYNYLRWFLQSYQGTFDPLLSSVENAYGVFGSASYIKAETLLLKNFN